MDKAVFDKFRTLIFSTSGISLSEQKEALVSARIGKRMRALKMDKFESYLKVVEKDQTGEELKELLNAISTNVTHFFRENRHYDVMKGLIGKWSQEGKTRMRIWCAACSTGEEPYSIAMTALEVMNRKISLDIIASDISTKVLQVAKFGVYKDTDIQGIDESMLKKYFERGVGKADRLFRTKKQLRNMVTFHQINLSTPPYPIESGLDIIFCRNVMIYFDQNLRQILIQNFTKMLKKDGYLFVGMAESLSNLHKELARIEPSVYQKQ